ncbi:26S proteasome non-ATPase regulatory subunit 4 homolog [Rutidosis leptorrhynchoides]|uniref:26S proteasome non-ATPase regulatory subunit 4 homolog n=1 Tax=Rutidosis leptorrhynchoides TaxID=125765 RepID=UPI003A999CF7
MAASDPFTEETILICIDNSQWMKSHVLSYALQLNCARSYCRAKLKSNPKNAIGILTLTLDIDNLADKWLRPTSDVDKILSYLKTLQYSGLQGDLCFAKGILLIQNHLTLKSIKLKRMLFFARGPADLCQEIESAEWYGKRLKENGVAVDVVTFYRNEQHLWDWKMALDVCVAAANNNNNSHIKHVQPDSSTLVSHVLSRCKASSRANNKVKLGQKVKLSTKR